MANNPLSPADKEVLINDLIRENADTRICDYLAVLAEIEQIKALF